MPAGLGPGGLQIKTLEEIRDDILARLKQPPPNGLGIDVDTSPSSNLYRLVSIHAYNIHLAWQGLLEVWDALNPDNADGVQLDNVSALVGVTRLEATKANGTVRCYGTVGTTIPDWTDPTPGVVRKGSTGDLFNILPEPTGGTWVVGGVGYVDVLVEAQTAGQLSISSDQIQDIVNPIAGWTSVNNPAALGTWTDQGTDEETDDELRQRREESLSITGTAADQAIRAALAAIDEVTSAFVLSNRAITADPVTGQPAKSFWTIIYPDLSADADAEDEIAQTIWERMPAGIEAWGDPAGTIRTATITDSQGYDQTLTWQYASGIDCAVKVTRTVDASLYPADGDAQIKTCVQNYFAGLRVGDDVNPGPMYGTAGDIAGVLTVQIQLKLKAALPFVAWPGDAAPITIADDEIGLIDAADITVA